VTPRFVARFPSVFAGFDNRPGDSVRWVTVEEEDDRRLQEAIDFGSRLVPKPAGFQPTTFHWAIVEKYMRRYPARHSLQMDLDELIFALGAGREAPHDFSGILFLAGLTYRGEDADASFRRRAFNAVQTRLLRDRVIRHRQLRVIFSLDQAVVADLAGEGTARIEYLPDPVPLAAVPPPPTGAERAAVRAALGIPEDERRLFLLFGDIRARKGIWKLFAALPRLSPEAQKRLRLAIVGHVSPALLERLGREIGDATARTAIAIVKRFGYVPDAEMNQWFAAADVALAPYIHHVGSSGVLLLAAAHGVPVVSQAAGLMGRTVAANRLGLTADPADPAALAAALEAFLGEDPPASWDREAGYAYARRHTQERFAETLFGALDPYLKG